MKKTMLSQFTSLTEVHIYLEQVREHESEYASKRNKIDAQIEKLTAQIEQLQQEKRELLEYYARTAI